MLSMLRLMLLLTIFIWLYNKFKGSIKLRTPIVIDSNVRETLLIIETNSIVDESSFKKGKKYLERFLIKMRWAAVMCKYPVNFEFY